MGVAGGAECALLHGPRLPPQPQTPLAKGGGGGGKQRQRKQRGDRREGGNNDPNSRLLAQIKLLEEQNRSLKQELTEKEKAEKGTDKDEDEELVADDADDDATVTADVENLAALQRGYDAMLVQLGADDVATKALRERLDAARAKQRAGKPIFQQVQVAQRKATRHERLHDAAKSKLQELECKRAELDKEIAEQTTKVSSAADELAKCRIELGELLERAKAEKGTTAPPSTAAASTDGAASALGGIRGAAAAWNAAKLAIQQQLAALPAGIAPEVQRAVSAQYEAMEAVLNNIPAPPPPTAPATPAPLDSADNGPHNGTPTPPTDASANGNGDDTTAICDGGGAPNEMLDVDDSVLEKLAEIFTGSSEGADTSSNAVHGDDDATDEDHGDGGRKARRLMDSRGTAARQYLAGKIPLRKPQLKHGGKAKWLDG